MTESKYNALSASQKALYCDADGESGGAITGVSITDDGEYLAQSGRGAGGGSGSGATFNLGYGTRAGTFGTSTYLKSVSVKNGGTGYKVGDTFRVAGVDFSPSIQQPATFKVTSATPITGGGGKRYLKSPSTRVREVSTQLNVRIWNPVDDGNDGNDQTGGGCQPSGQTLRTVTVTGSKAGGDDVFGCGPYTNESDIATAAVHAGVIDEGDRAEINVISAGASKVSNWPGGCLQNGVATSGASGAAFASCPISLSLKRLITGDTQGGCDRSQNIKTRLLTVSGNDSATVGIPTAIEAVNPEAKPGQGVPSDSQGINSNDWNWYASCPISSNNLPAGMTTDDTCPFAWRFVSGPSEGLGLEKGTLTFSLDFTWYTESSFPGAGCSPPGLQIGNEVRWNGTRARLEPGYSAWNPKPGHAIGDIWEFYNFDCKTNNSGQANDCKSCSGKGIEDTNFRIRISAVDGATQITESQLAYRIEENVSFKYSSNCTPLNSTNNTVVVDWTDSSDPILNTSARVVFNKFNSQLSRPPRATGLEFEKYVNLVYDAGGNWTTAINTQFNSQFNNERNFNCANPPELLGCNEDPGGDVVAPSPNTPDNQPNPSPAPTGGDTQCKHDRNTFYRGTGGTTNGQVDLYEIWSWLGSPRNNPNPICPRPTNDSGLVQDNEPDMTDFAGMKIQRWESCGNGNIGKAVEEIVPCVSGNAEGLSLSYFIDTRIAPWWGDQELAPPTLTMTKSNDNVYLVNVPPTQNDTYFCKATPALDGENKRYFKVEGNIFFPELTGTPTPGEPVIGPLSRSNKVKISWYRRTSANPNLVYLGGTDAPPPDNIEEQGVKIQSGGTPILGESGDFATWLEELEVKNDGQCTEAEANNLDWAQTGREYFCKVEIDNKPYDPKGNGTTYLPGFGGQDNNVTTYERFPSRFFLNKIDCQDASVGCSGNSVKEVKTNEPTTITFSMSINTNCLQYRSGTARISIRRFWPCPVFGPPDPRKNTWVVQKQTVGIPQTSASSAQISYTLTVNTDKTDYLPGNDGVDVDPGGCHWVYYAYWEIDYPGVDCRSNAWSNPGCNTGKLNSISQIYCLQDQQCGQGGPASPGGSTPNTCNGTGWDPGQYDFEVCLPYCWTSEQGCAKNFYWCYQQPQPGVNCSGTGSAPSPNGSDNAEPGTSPYGPGCECPICEQSIMVRILEGTECGIMGKPNQVEGGGEGPNNGRVEIYSPSEGFTYINDAQTNPTVLNKDVLKDCDPEAVPGTTPDQKCLEFYYSAWVYLVRKTFNELTTLGNDAAVRIVDYEKGEIDCDERVFSQASLYVQYKYKSGTSSGIQALPIYLGGPVYNSYLRKYNPGAGTNTESMRYDEEVGISSYKRTFGFVDMSYDIETIESVKIFLNITSTNDYFGNSAYHPPPAGLIESDFGTTDYVLSQRGSQGAGGINPARKTTFQIANFAIADKVDLPEFKSPTGITCPTNPVPYDGVRVTPDIFEFCCGGEIGGCQNTSTSFACQGACEGGGCDKQPLSGPKQEITACATNQDGIFAIDWKDIEPSERKQLTILWYFGKSQFRGCCISAQNLSQGETCSPDINNISKLAQPETSYKLSYYIVASSDGDVSYRDISYDDNDPSTGYYARLSWLLTPNINSCQSPFQTIKDVKDGERWQTIMGSGSCTIITGKDLDTVSIENPTGGIDIVNITNPDGSTDGGPNIDCSKGSCCNPANSEYYSRRCIDIRAGLQANGIPCCNFSSPSPNVNPSPGTPGGPGPGSPTPQGPFGPFGPFGPLGPLGPIQPF